MSELNPRLMLAAGFVRKNTTVADIGTDHAYLPIYLAKKGSYKNIIACDINEGPIVSAKNNIIKNGLSHLIETRLCDGLSGVEKDEADDIVICGMGGLLIIKILSDCPWLKIPGKRFILQPQRDADAVRKYMFENGFELIAERAVWDNGRIYTVNVWEYDGVMRIPDSFLCLTGKLTENPTENEKAYLKKIIYSLEKRLDGLKASQNYRHDKEISQLENLIDQIKKFL